jgi:hypothetical protein
MLFNLGNLEEYKFTKDIVILYHGGCVDGFTGAWAAYKKFGDNADYFGITDREIIPDGLTGKEVYMIDICFPQELNSFPRVNPWYPMASHHMNSYSKRVMTGFVRSYLNIYFITLNLMAKGCLTYSTTLLK